MIHMDIEGKIIVMANTYTIDEYDDIAREFLEEIFGIDFNSCFISDESSLWDFSGCCIPENHERDFSLPKEESLKACYDAGRDNMVRLIKEKYNINIDANDYLITVFEKIRQSRNITLN